MMTRRAAILGGVATAAVSSASARTETDVDVAIVGAGAAGISAARALVGAGLSHVVLEARDRVGGRAWTVGGLGQPFDMGAHWLHVAQSNPLVPSAKAEGLDLTESDPNGVRLFADGALRPDTDHEAFAAAVARIERRAILPSMFGRDRPISALAPEDDPWSRLALSIPAIEMAEEPDRVSFRDYASLGTGADLVVPIGLGGLVASLAAGLNIRLSAPVTEIRWQEAGGVTLSGAFGMLTARAAIVTLPTSLLAAETIRFVPDLPDATRQAVVDLPMGVFEKVGFLLDRPLLDLPEYAFATGPQAQGLTHALHFSPDRRVVTVILAADTARDLIAAGAQERVAVARFLLADVIGAQPEPAAVLTTDWLGDPLARGAYTHAKVGSGDARKHYATPLADRLWLAGEAAPGEHAVTAGGAWISGMMAAKAVAQVLRA